MCMIHHAAFAGFEVEECGILPHDHHMFYPVSALGIPSTMETLFLSPRELLFKSVECDESCASWAVAFQNTHIILWLLRIAAHNK